MMLALLGQDPSAAPIDTPSVDWFALAPLVALGAGALLLLTLTSLVRRLPTWVPLVWTLAWTTTAGVFAVAQWFRLDDLAARDQPAGWSTMAAAIGVDRFTVFLTLVIGAGVVLAALLADGYLRDEKLAGPELYVLMLLSASGGVIMAMANDLVVLFLGLEILSIAAYLLAAMHLRRQQSQEAGMKYFVLGAFSSAFLLYGIALVYGATGSTNLIDIRAFLDQYTLVSNGMLLAGFAMLLVGLGFKVAAVPFHAWTPDVYQGSPTPVVAYMASAVKAAGFAALLRVFVLTFVDYRTDWQPLVYGLAVATLVVGAVLAVVQTNVKRMLAYSSINHAGFILIGVQAATDEGTSAALFYLAVYTFMVAGTFGVVTLVAGRGDGHHELSDFVGLSGRQPVVAFTMTVLLLAQAGVPFTSGFFAKFNIISAAVDARSFGLAVTAMVTAVISAYLYLRIIVSMYFTDGTAPERSAVGDSSDRSPVSLGARVALILAVGVTVAVGLVPGPLVDRADQAVPQLVATAE